MTQLFRFLVLMREGCLPLHHRYRPVTREPVVENDLRPTGQLVLWSKLLLLVCCSRYTIRLASAGFSSQGHWNVIHEAILCYCLGLLTQSAMLCYFLLNHITLTFSRPHIFSTITKRTLIENQDYPSNFFRRVAIRATHHVARCIASMA